MSSVAMRVNTERGTAVPVPRDARRPAPSLAEQRAARRRNRGFGVAQQIPVGA